MNPICPRCGDQYAMHPALSRTDNETLICSSCGTDEAMRDWLSGDPGPRSQWAFS